MNKRQNQSMEALKKHEIHLHNQNHESQQNHPRLWVGHQGQGQGQGIEFMLPSSFDDEIVSPSAFTYPHNQPMVPFEQQSITVSKICKYQHELLLMTIVVVF